jgi:hypothetical protein
MQSQLRPHNKSILLRLFQAKTNPLKSRICPKLNASFPDAFNFKMWLKGCPNTKEIGEQNFDLIDKAHVSKRGHRPTLTV